MLSSQNTRLPGVWLLTLQAVTLAGGIWSACPQGKPARGIGQGSDTICWRRVFQTDVVTGDWRGTRTDAGDSAIVQGDTEAAGTPVEAVGWKVINDCQHTVFRISMRDSHLWSQVSGLGGQWCQSERKEQFTVIYLDFIGPNQNNLVAEFSMVIRQKEVWALIWWYTSYEVLGKSFNLSGLQLPHPQNVRVIIWLNIYTEQW